MKSRGAREAEEGREFSASFAELDTYCRNWRPSIQCFLGTASQSLGYQTEDRRPAHRSLSSLAFDAQKVA
ncbi:hypothetical protein CVIRNUC_008130 [Coccomyxa viridis]|uniref:Uncharacterized protein n=1 Tax=Coccomyxa viridis TaxID=1274662 RepID=A0AAV1IG04_9CHLO|nr:hypothetical protein CVIRNUC_008130 [Coccomyxa viridis]